MIELFDNSLKKAERKSSKGNQLKFDSNGFWYKADCNGYEGFAECVVSSLLRCSSLDEKEYAKYSYETIVYNGVCYRGCKSEDFTDGWKLITLERLFIQSCGESLNRLIYNTADHTERLQLLVDMTERITGLKEFGPYMNKLLTLDAIFLNEDRHSHNIAVLMDDRNQFRLCPIFDNGGALLSDTTMDYPLGRSVYELMDKVRPKTFADSFEEQLEISEKLYGRNISFTYGSKEIIEVVDSLPDYIEEKDRVKEILFQSKRKYGYLFESH